MVPFAALGLRSRAHGTAVALRGRRARRPCRGLPRPVHRPEPARSFAWEEPLGDSIRLAACAGGAGASLRPGWTTLGRPLVYITLGTVFNKPELLRQLLDGLDGSVSALVTTGRNVDPESLGGRPSNVRVERFVPQEQVLPRCAAVVSHAGSGSVRGALAHGLPLRPRPAGGRSVRQRCALRRCGRRGRGAAGRADSGRCAARAEARPRRAVVRLRRRGACRPRSGRCRPLRRSYRGSRTYVARG